MKSLYAYLIITSSILARSQLVAFTIERADDSPLLRDQQPLLDPSGPIMSAASPEDPRPAAAQGTVILSDVMGRDRSINIFAGLVRDLESASRRLDDQGQNTTVLAPLNSAVEKLPRKPWEDPRDYGALGDLAYEGDDGYERAQRNLRRFVEAHMIPASPWKENDKVRPIGDDREVWWETKDGHRVVSNSNSPGLAQRPDNKNRSSLATSRWSKLRAQWPTAKW